MPARLRAAGHLQTPLAPALCSGLAAEPLRGAVAGAVARRASRRRAMGVLALLARVCNSECSHPETSPDRAATGLLSPAAHGRVVGVAALLPVPGHELVGDLDAHDPLHVLVAELLRDHQAQRAAVRRPGAARRPGCRRAPSSGASARAPVGGCSRTRVPLARRGRRCTWPPASPRRAPAPCAEPRRPTVTSSAVQPYAVEVDRLVDVRGSAAQATRSTRSGCSTSPSTSRSRARSRGPAPPAAQHRAGAHRRRTQLLPPGRGHHRAEGDAGGAGALRARPAPPGDDPRRAQHGAQGPARAAGAGPAGARAADRLQRRAAHRTIAGTPQPLLPPPAGAAGDRRAPREPAGDRRAVRAAPRRGRRVRARADPSRTRGRRPGAPRTDERRDRARCST